MADEGENPVHPAVEGPESPLDETRKPRHDADEGSDALEARVAALEAELAAKEDASAKQEAAWTERLARLQADFDNFRRRAREDASAASGRGKEALLRDILPFLDSFDRAAAHTQDEGLKLVARQLADALAAAGIVAIAPEGDAFDAGAHEALATEAHEGAKRGTVLRVVEKGYRLDGRVVRPARVVVAA